MSPVSKRASGRRSSRRSISAAERDSNTSTMERSLIRYLLRDIAPTHVPIGFASPAARYTQVHLEYKVQILRRATHRRSCAKTPECLPNTSRFRDLHVLFDECAESCLVQLHSMLLQRYLSSLWRRRRQG